MSDAASPTKTVRDIIREAGGPAAVVAACSQDLTVDAVYKWHSNGVPDRYWPFILPLAKATPDEMFAANELARAEKAASEQETAA
jgi:hypothetical protein